MSVVNFAGLLAILGALGFTLGLVPINPLIQHQNRIDPIAYISNNKSTVRFSAILTILGILLSSAAFPFWWASLQSAETRALNAVGGLLLGSGVIFWAIYSYLRVERAQEYPFFALTWQGAVSAISTITGLGIYGVLFINTAVANWLGYLFIGSSMVFIVCLVLQVLPTLVYFIPISVAGVVFLIS